MLSLSNQDFALVVRLLKSFSKTKGETLRDINERRVAHLLYRKLEKRKKSAK